MTGTASTAQAAPAQAPVPVKYSRYAKVRRAQTFEPAAPERAPAPAPAAASMASEVPKTITNTGTIARSMSRYRKNRPMAPSAALGEVPATPILGDLARYEKAYYDGDDDTGGRSVEDSKASGCNPYKTAQQTEGREEGRNSNKRPGMVKRMSDHQSGKYNESKASPNMIELQQQTDEKAEVAQKLLEKVKREDLARLEATLEAAGSQPVRGRAESQSTWDRLKRKMSRPRETVSPHTSAATTDRKISTAQEALPRPRKQSERIIAGGNGRVDAPGSESTEGRKVDIRFATHHHQFTIQKPTTASDLITTAVQVFNTHFRADAAVLKESYRSDGLRIERRLRLYELVTPVLNSWDRDTQNELILEASDSPRHDMDLLARGAPQERPKPTSIHMYHSFLKGRWYKYWVTLQASGQIVLTSSKPEAGRSLKTYKEIAHMSDFDIYTLSEKELKAVKPKRKFCCVVKSQQKQTLFDNSQERFVHFFSTGRAEDHQEWMDACQSWRSWYLSQQKDDKPSSAVAVPHSSSRAYNDGVHGQIDYAKNSSLPRKSGSYKPLALNTSFGRNEGYDSDTRKDLRDFVDENYDSDYRSPVSAHQTQTRQVPFHLRHGNQTKQMMSAPIPQEPFHQGGLLGRSYSQRQKALHENAPRMALTANADFHAGAFTGGLLAQTANGHANGHGNGGGLINSAGGGQGRSNSLAGGNGNGGRSNSLVNGNGNGYTSRPSTSQHNSAHNTPKTYAADSMRRPSFAGSRPGTANSTKSGGNGSFGSIPPVPDLPKLQPLVDMTPEFKEAPQWRSEGKGRGVRVPEGVPLVDAAGSRWEKEKEYHPEEFRRTNTLKGGYR